MYQFSCTKLFVYLDFFFTEKKAISSILEFLHDEKIFENFVQRFLNTSSWSWWFSKKIDESKSIFISELIVSKDLENYYKKRRTFIDISRNNFQHLKNSKDIFDFFARMNKDEKIIIYRDIFEYLVSLSDDEIFLLLQNIIKSQDELEKFRELFFKDVWYFDIFLQKL